MPKLSANRSSLLYALVVGIGESDTDAFGQALGGVSIEASIRHKLSDGSTVRPDQLGSDTTWRALLGTD